MEQNISEIIRTEYVTHDVRKFEIKKPYGYYFTPGQATEVSINKPGWEHQTRPFTFTGLNHWNHLEFIIKIYPERNGVTKELEKLKAGDSLIIREPWGAINYMGSGVFIAGGAGITPFIAILRQLHYEKKIHGNKLIFSNKTFEDIILKEELSVMLSENFYNILTREHVIGYLDKRIDEDMLIDIVKDFNQYFYVCGPDGFVNDIAAKLERFGAKPDTIVIEKAEA